VRICWAGSFDTSFERNQRLREYLDAASLDYQEVRVDIWPKDYLNAFRNRRLPVLLRMAIVYPVLIARLLLTPAPDLYLVSYPGWFDVPIVKLVAWIKRRPVVFDIFISLYDTAISDRGLACPDSVLARFIRLIDRISMRLSQRVISDCPAHARFLAELAGLPLDRFGIVYVGADEAVFRPTQPKAVLSDLVVFYGNFIPLHGTEWIVKAAALLQDRGCRFRIIGKGQELNATMRLASDLDAANVQFVDPMPKAQLVDEMASATLCLGIFGTTDKTNRVIPHKVFEALACGCPVLTGATEAIDETFDDGEVAVCPTGDPESLAEHIERLLKSESERLRIARNGRERFEKDFSLAPQSERLKQELQRVAG
jgi:glycosyltransferase involved in cell wall biosynthesis